jgi:hypothetical protein
MGGGKTTRAIKNSTTPPIRTAQMSLGLRPVRRSLTRRSDRTGSHGPRLQTIRVDARTELRARAAPPIRRVRVAGEAAGLAKAKAREARAREARAREGAAAIGKAGVARGIEEDGAGDANAVRMVEGIARTATAKTMVVTSTSNWRVRMTPR